MQPRLPEACGLKPAFANQASLVMELPIVLSAEAVPLGSTEKTAAQPFKASVRHAIQAHTRRRQDRKLAPYATLASSCPGRVKYR